MRRTHRTKQGARWEALLTDLFAGAGVLRDLFAQHGCWENYQALREYACRTGRGDEYRAALRLSRSMARRRGQGAADAL